MMHHTADLAQIELITAYSYILIAVGFGIRWLMSRNTAQRAESLWPPLLLSIFVICGGTRLVVFTGIPVNETFLMLTHLMLMLLSISYGLAQILLIIVPEALTEHTDFPRLG